MQSMRQLADAIARGAASQWLNEHAWVVPVSQSIHILCVGLILGSAAVVSVRLMGWRPQGRPLSLWLRTLVPWVRGALAGLLCTGLLQVVTEPVRQFVTPHFWWKMGLVLAAAGALSAFARAVQADPRRWDDPSARPALAKAYALGSLAAWITIAVLGRMIGYVWLDYA